MTGLYLICKISSALIRLKLENKSSVLYLFGGKKLIIVETDGRVLTFKKKTQIGAFRSLVWKLHEKKIKEQKLRSKR